jgi:RNA polymerase sigma factor (TIGR02999 family)
MANSAPQDHKAADVTRALVALSAGDSAAMDRLLPLVYDHLRRVAERELRRERAGHTLSPTALVHEAYLKLVQLDRITWEGRAHFFGAAASAMRRILISYARMHKAEKRGSGAERVPIEDVVLAARDRPADLLALDEALTRLAAAHPRQAQVVELRFFAGMEIEAVADALGVSAPTIKRDWTAARAWLNRELTE